jgi:stage III sporulation protein AG
VEWLEVWRRVEDQLGFGPAKSGGRAGLARRTWWLIILGLIGCLLIVAGEAFAPPVKNPQPKAEPVVAPGRNAANDSNYAAEVQAGLTEVLGQIAGAGEVSVRVYLGSGPRYEYAQKTSTNARTTEEKDQAGGVRTITERDEGQEVTVVRNDSIRKEEPIILVRHEPEIRGVLVLATGAGDSAVREALSLAVQTALGLPAHRVEVLAKGVR